MHFHDNEKSFDQLQRDEFELFKPKNSNWTPDGQFTSVDLFVKKCRVDIQTLNLNKSPKFSNLSKEEWTAHENLKIRDDIVIKPADKGGAVVVWRTDLYKQKLLDNLPTLNFMQTWTKTLHSPIKKSPKIPLTLFRQGIFGIPWIPFLKNYRYKHETYTTN